MKSKEHLLNSRLENYTRNTAQYDDSGNFRITALVLTASAAAGLGALICPPPAEAAVQYSGLRSIPLGTSVLPARQGVDLNNDTIDDFFIHFLRYQYQITNNYTHVNMEQNIFVLSAPSGNSVIVEQDGLYGGSSLLSPARLPNNYTIQSSLPAGGTRQWKAFTSGTTTSTSGPNFLGMKLRQTVEYFSTSGSTTYSTKISYNAGQFIGKKGYLGVRFQISGQTHYGWVQFAANEELKSGSIIDWAYEDQPNIPIKAGAGRFNWNLFLPAIVNGAKGTP